MLRTIALCSFLMMSFAAVAQLQDNNWCMGRGAGVRFDNSPTPFATQISTIETTAAISNKSTGDLQFYTDGARVWDATHTVMPNGMDVGPDAHLQSATQGAVIVPFIDDEHKYYLFSMASTNPNHGNLYYSVIDMTLNAGLGDVVPNQKSIKIGEGLTEGMVAVSGCDKVWLITQKRSARDFHVYEITTAGVNTIPVVSTTSYNYTSTGMSCFKVSADGKKLASLGNIYTGQFGTIYLALHDFNKVTGTISNGQVIGINDEADYYDCEFSANGTRLYASGNRKVYQYDISQPTTAQISQSKRLVKAFSGIGSTGLQRRPNGDICVVRYGKDKLDKITNADNLVPSCVYTESIVPLGGTVPNKLPQLIVYAQRSTQNITKLDTTMCNGQPLLLRASANSLPNTWQDGSVGDSFLVEKKGLFWVSNIDEQSCVASVDTFLVDSVVVKATIAGNDTTICEHESIVLHGSILPANAQGRWNTGSNNSSIEVSERGVYTLQVKHQGCTDIDSIEVRQYERTRIDLGKDRELCKGDRITLPLIASSPIVDKYTWQDGSTGRTLQVTKPGLYYVEVTNHCQTLRDSVRIINRNCFLFFPDAFTPNGDGRNDFARMVGDISVMEKFQMRIANRWGEVVYQTNSVAQGWDGKHRGKPAEVGVYYYLIKYTYQGSEEQLKGTITLLR